MGNLVSGGEAHRQCGELEGSEVFGTAPFGIERGESVKAAVLKLKQVVPIESDEARWLIQWAATQRWGDRRLSDLLIMIPNGAVLAGDAKQRAMQMAKMKRTGFRPGVFDYLLPIPRDGAPGLWVELKRRNGGIVSDEQGLFKLDMEVLGWATAICKGWDEAKDAINCSATIIGR